MHSIKTLLVILLACTLSMASAQQFKETITEELNFSSASVDNQLVVNNINGSVEVEGYNGNTIQLEIEKTIKADSNKDLEKGKNDVGIQTEELGDRVFIFFRSPNTEFDRNTGEIRHRNNHYQERQDYHYNFDIKVKVPRQTNLKVLTINNGDIHIEEVHAKKIKVSNINGGITMENITGVTYANALNRDIVVSYKTNPPGDSEYHSLNGDIKITFQNNLNADVYFKSLNGDLYTNFDMTRMAAQATKNSAKSSKGVKYKVKGNERFRIGDGGVQLDFKVLNGDVYIKS